MLLEVQASRIKSPTKTFFVGGLWRRWGGGRKPLPLEIQNNRYIDPDISWTVCFLFAVAVFLSSSKFSCKDGTERGSRLWLSKEGTAVIVSSRVMLKLSGKCPRIEMKTWYDVFVNRNTFPFRNEETVKRVKNNGHLFTLIVGMCKDMDIADVIKIMDLGVDVLEGDVIDDLLDKLVWRLSWRSDDKFLYVDPVNMLRWAH